MRLKTRCHVAAPMLLLIGWVLMSAASPAVASDNNQLQVDYEAGFYYTVKKGDTLWDLSQRFSDTPWQWPDLWKENTQLTNPHWIYPGERIRLFRKTDQHRVGETKPVPVPQVQPQVETSEPAQAQAPPVDFIYANIDRVGFIRSPKVSPNGIIFKSLDDKKLISKDDIVYIRPADSEQGSEFVPGSRYTVFRNLDPYGDKLSKSSGDQHYLLGVVEITTNKPQYATAKVIEQYDAILIDDLLMPYEPQQPIIQVVESVPGIKGQIIAAEVHSVLLGDYAIGFIDKGSDDNIQRGQIYNIYYQETTNTGGQTIELDPVDIGTVFVLRTEKEISTVVVTSSSRKITKGQPIRTP